MQRTNNPEGQGTEQGQDALRFAQNDNGMNKSHPCNLSRNFLVYVVFCSGTPFSAVRLS
jgi:hypothetical protein